MAFLSRKISVGQRQKSRTILDFIEARDDGVEVVLWDHMPPNVTFTGWILFPMCNRVEELKANCVDVIYLKTISSSGLLSNDGDI